MQNYRIDEILERLWIQIVEKNIQKVDLLQFDEILNDSILEEIQNQGWIMVSEGCLHFTESGYQQAQLMIRRHRLAERLFWDVIDTRDELMEEAACQTEHILKEGIDEKVCTLLGHPKICPHSRHIPPGECCLKAEEAGEKLVDAMTNLKPNQQGKIAYLRTRDALKTHKLMAMGVIPGRSIKLLRRYPSYVFTVGYTQFAIDSEMAEQIYVRVSVNNANSD